MDDGRFERRDGSGEDLFSRRGAEGAEVERRLIRRWKAARKRLGPLLAPWPGLWTQFIDGSMAQRLEGVLPRYGLYSTYTSIFAF